MAEVNYTLTAVGLSHAACHFKNCICDGLRGVLIKMSSDQALQIQSTRICSRRLCWQPAIRNNVIRQCIPHYTFLVVLWILKRCEHKTLRANYAHKHSILRLRITSTPTAIIHRNNISPFAHVLVTLCMRMLSERTVKADFPYSSNSGTEPLCRAGFVPNIYAYFKVSPRSASSTPYLAFLFPEG